MEPQEACCGQLARLLEDQGRIPSNDSKRGLKPPMVNVFDHADIPKQVRAKDVIP